MEEAISQDGRKRRLEFEPASERGSDKRRRTCCHGEDCELTTKVLAQESTIRNLAAVIEQLLGRLADLEGQPSSTIGVDHTRAEASKRQSCPADNCTKAFDRTDHLHRHIRGIHDAPHRSLARALDQKYCVQCNKDFKRPCDLVRHEKSFHDEIYVSRAYKFASHHVGSAGVPTPPDTSSDASVDWGDLASESEQEDVEVSEPRHNDHDTAQNGSNILSDFLDQNISLTSDQVHEFSACFDAAPSDFQSFLYNDIDGINNLGFIPPAIPIHHSFLFDATPIDCQGYSHLDHNSSDRAGLTHGFLPFFERVPADLPLIFTQEL